MRGRWWPWLLLVLALVPALLINQPHPSIGGTPPTVNVSEAIFGNPGTLDPALASSSSEWAIDANIFQPLFRLSGTGQVEPNLATHYAIKGKTITLTIDPVPLAGGGHLTAADAAGALSRPLWPTVKSSTATTLLKPVKGFQAVVNGKSQYLSGITVVNKNTMTITLKHAAGPGFIKALANPALSVVPVADMKRGGPDWQFANLYGTGGYRLEEWNPGGSLTFSKIQGTGPAVLSVPIYRSFKKAVLSFANQAVMLVPVQPSQLARIPQKLMKDVAAFREPGNLSLEYRTGAKNISTYPNVSVGKWVDKSFRGVIGSLNGNWPPGIPTGKPMTIYVNENLPEAVQLAKTLQQMRPHRVTVRMVPLTTLETLAKRKKIGAYIGQTDWFNNGTAVRLAPIRSLWLKNPAIRGAKVYANGALDWHSLAGKP